VKGKRGEKERDEMEERGGEARWKGPRFAWVWGPRMVNPALVRRP